MSSRSRFLALLMAIFLGPLGIHRFYTGHAVTGLIQLLTGGGCLLWMIYDVVTIALGTFRDADGLPLS
ncbi:MAG: TM2 domain-containing protein [Armatimonadetes bacterium]|nr:TM2 domain-containing protein [Armatimonadota bacterium]